MSEHWVDPLTGARYALRIADPESGETLPDAPGVTLTFPDGRVLDLLKLSDDSNETNRTEA